MTALLNRFDQKQSIESLETRLRGLLLISLIMEHNYRNLLFIDRSGRPIGLTAKFMARQLKTTVNCRFMNPENLLNGNIYESFYLCKEQFITTHRLYYDQRETEPILLVDTCMHRGYTMMDSKLFLRKIGFKYIKTAVFDFSPNTISCKRPDHIIDTAELTPKCYPFGKDRIISNPEEGIISVPNVNVNNGFQLRRSLYSMLNEQGTILDE